MAPGSLPAGVARVADGDRVVGSQTRTVVLVEGLSDRVALEVLADRRGIAVSYASRIRRGERRRQLGARGASVFNLGGMHG